MKIREYIQVKAAGAAPDPAVYCPANGYIDPDDPDSGYIPNPINPADGWFLIAEFQNNSPNSTTFDPTITASGEYAWDLGDGTICMYDKSISHTYLTTATRTVKLWGKGTCIINQVDFRSDNIIGELDLSHSAFASCTIWRLFSNSSLTSIVFPSTISATVTEIAVYSNALSGTLDLSMFSSFSSALIHFYSNSSVTGVTFASSITGSVSALIGYSCNLTGTLDVSAITSLSSMTYQFNNNSNLTAITFPASPTGNVSAFLLQSTGLTGTLNLTQFTSFVTGASIQLNSCASLTGVTFASTLTGSFQNLYFYSSGFSGTLDLSMFKSFSNGDIRFYSCAGLTAVTLAGSATTGAVKFFYGYSITGVSYLDLTYYGTSFNTFDWRFNNNGWGAAIVNQILTVIDGISAAGFTGRVINIGGTNTDPDTTSGGYNGTAARTSLQGKGFTVTIT